MKFNFKIQQYQTDAVEAVVNIFKGQGLHERVGYLRDMGTLEENKQLSFLAEDTAEDEELLDLENSMGYKNEAVQLTDTELLKNIHEMQTANNIRLSPNLIKELAMCNHSYGQGIDNATGEAVSGGICSYMMGRNKSKYTESLLNIAEVMSANYNLVFTDNGEAPPEIWGKTRSYIEWIGAEGGALEINSRDGFITDPNNEAEGNQFTARVMEAAYTQLLQFLYMLIDRH